MQDSEPDPSIRKSPLHHRRPKPDAESHQPPQEDWQGGHKMDAQTQLVAELYKTLNDAQKQEVCNMIDTLLSQQLNDQQSLDSHSAATENQDSIAWERLHVPADQSKTRSHSQPPREAGNSLPPPVQKIKEEKQNEFLIYEKFREETV